MALEKQYFLHFAFQLVPKWDTGHGATGTRLHPRRPAGTELTHSPIANIENVNEFKENFDHNLQCYAKVPIFAAFGVNRTQEVNVKLKYPEISLK
jgi:hypothetical protein